MSFYLSVCFMSSLFVFLMLLLHSPLRYVCVQISLRLFQLVSKCCCRLIVRRRTIIQPSDIRCLLVQKNIAVYVLIDRCDCAAVIDGVGLAMAAATHRTQRGAVKIYFILCRIYLWKTRFLNCRWFGGYVDETHRILVQHECVFGQCDTWWSTKLSHSDSVSMRCCEICINNQWVLWIVWSGQNIFFHGCCHTLPFFSMRLFHNFNCRFCHTSRQPNFLQIFLPKFAPAHVPISKSDFIISFKCQIVLRNTSSSSIMWSCTQLTCWVMNSNRYRYKQQRRTMCNQQAHIQTRSFSIKIYIKNRPELDQFTVRRSHEQ